MIWLALFLLLLLSLDEQFAEMNTIPINIGVKKFFIIAALIFVNFAGLIFVIWINVIHLVVYDKNFFSARLEYFNP